jgi:hypothetical protein
MTNLTIKYFLKYSWVILFNIILALYLSELVMTIFVKPQFNKYIDIDYLRYQRATELGVDFDTRSSFQAFIEEKKKEPSLSPNYYYDQKHLTRGGGGDYPSIRNFIQSKLDNNDLIPLRGPINKKTLGCNEDGKKRIYSSDKYGFRNPNSIYQKEIKIFLLGDSFTEGDCQDADKNISTVLRNKFGINTATYGIGGAGPLLSLAAFIEYVTDFKPDFVIYLYYEGNDMEDLKLSKETFLINYLGDFKQNLIDRNDEVKEFLTDYENLVYEAFEKESETEYDKLDVNVEQKIKESKKREKIEMVKDFFELQKLKTFFLTSSTYGHENAIDKKLFTRILRKFKSETAEWNGKFIVVYLPEWNRFNQKSFTHFFHKKKIESIIKSLNIPYIDMVQEFEKEEDPINFYPFGLFGHYTAEGYRLVAESIFKNITD